MVTMWYGPASAPLSPSIAALQQTDYYQYPMVDYMLDQTESQAATMSSAATTSSATRMSSAATVPTFAAVPAPAIAPFALARIPTDKTAGRVVDQMTLTESSIAEGMMALDEDNMSPLPAPSGTEFPAPSADDRVE
jgi:hypothetical protein